MANRILETHKDMLRTVTLEETFSDSPFPDNRYLYVVRTKFKDGGPDAYIGHYNKDAALFDYNVIVGIAKGLGLDFTLDRR